MRYVSEVRSGANALSADCKQYSERELVVVPDKRHAIPRRYNACLLRPFTNSGRQYKLPCRTARANNCNTKVLQKESLYLPLYLRGDNADNFIIVCAYKASVHICKKFSDFTSLERGLASIQYVHDVEQSAWSLGTAARASDGHKRRKACSSLIWNLTE